MKKCTLLTTLLLVLLINACSISVKINEDSQGIITATAYGDNLNGTVSQNGYLKIEVEGKDADGIKSVSIEIPSLNTDFIVDNKSGSEHWKFNQTFNIVNPVKAGLYNIYVLLTDNDGNQYSKTINFIIV